MLIQLNNLENHIS